MIKLFWKKKPQKNKKIMTSKEAAMALKSAANTILQDYSKMINPIEIVLLNSLVSHMDVFILKCFVNGKLKHTTWILARLLEIRIVLDASRNKEVKAIVDMIKALETLIYSEKVKNG